MTSIGLRIAKRRSDLGISQLQLARSAGISQPHVSTLESGASSPNIRTLSRLAHALGLKVNDLTEGL